MKIKHFFTLIIFSLSLLCCNYLKKRAAEDRGERHVKNIPEDKSLPALPAGFYLVSTEDTGVLYKRELQIPNEKRRLVPDSFLLTKEAFVSFKYVDTVYPATGSEYDQITLKFTNEGEQKFTALTYYSTLVPASEKENGIEVGLVVNNALINVAHVLQPIHGNGVSLSGDYSGDKMFDMIEFLRKGKNE